MPAGLLHPDRGEIGHDQPHDFVLEGAAPEERLLLHDGVADRGHQGARQYEHLLGREGSDQRPRAGLSGRAAETKAMIGSIISRPRPCARIACVTALRARWRPPKALTIACTMARTRPSTEGSLSPCSARPMLARPIASRWRQRQQDRVLVGEVLVERADADARPLGHCVGGEGRQSTGFENLSRRLQNQRNGLSRARLSGNSSFNFNGLPGLGHISGAPPNASMKSE